MSEYAVRNPYNDEVFHKFSWEDLSSVETKIDNNIKAQHQLKCLSSAQRAKILEKLARLLDQHKEEFISLLVKEIGKTKKDCQVEIERAMVTLQVAAIECTQITGEVLDTDSFGMTHNKRAIVEWTPVGCVLAITPFNFPLNLAMHKIAPAFAMGNSLIFKPHPQNYLSGQKLVELCLEAGMPKGSIEMIMPSNETMARVVAHPRVDLISLTGGVKAAQAISKNAGMKKLLFELGGNDPLIVLPDGDLDKAVMACINQRFGTAGQRCTAAKRIFIHKEIYSQFCEKLVTKTKELKVGDPADDSVFVGPVVSREAADEVMARIDDAVARGAKVLFGHKREGNIIYPTILENVPSDCVLVADETFGPVLPLREFSEIEEVIEVVNNCEFGLQSGVFTKDLDVIKKLFSELEVGALIVGDGPGFRAEHLPFGGVKESGIGSEGVRYTMREMAHRKMLVL